MLDNMGVCIYPVSHSRIILDKGVKLFILLVLFNFLKWIGSLAFLQIFKQFTMVTILAPMILILGSALILGYVRERLAKMK